MFEHLEIHLTVKSLEILVIEHCSMNSEAADRPMEIVHWRCWK